MKKLTTLFLAGLVLTATLAGCGQKTDQEATATDAGGTPVVLKVGATPIPH